MKKTALIIILSVIIIILGTVLYLFIETAPKQIENEEIGTMYTFGNISFDLVSPNYVQSEEYISRAKEDERLDIEKIMVWEDTQNGDTITLINFSDNIETVDIFEQSVESLSIPLLRKKIESNTTAILQESHPHILELNPILYKGSNKIGILVTSNKNDDSTTYHSDIRINNSYYTILPYQPNQENPLALENIMEFMRTVNISN